MTKMRGVFCHQLLMVVISSSLLFCNWCYHLGNHDSTTTATNRVVFASAYLTCSKFLSDTRRLSNKSDHQHYYNTKSNHHGGLQLFPKTNRMTSSTTTSSTQLRQPSNYYIVSPPTRYNDMKHSTIVVNAVVENILPTVRGILMNQYNKREKRIKLYNQKTDELMNIQQYFQYGMKLAVENHPSSYSPLFYSLPHAVHRRPTALLDGTWSIDKIAQDIIMKYSQIETSGKFILERGKLTWMKNYIDIKNVDSSLTKSTSITTPDSKTICNNEEGVIMKSILDDIFEDTSTFSESNYLTNWLLSLEEDNTRKNILGTDVNLNPWTNEYLELLKAQDEKENRCPPVEQSTTLMIANNLQKPKQTRLKLNSAKDLLSKNSFNNGDNGNSTQNNLSHHPVDDDKFAAVKDVLDNLLLLSHSSSTKHVVKGTILDSAFDESIQSKAEYINNALTKSIEEEVFDDQTIQAAEILLKECNHVLEEEQQLQQEGNTMTPSIIFEENTLSDVKQSAEDALFSEKNLIEKTFLSKERLLFERAREERRLAKVSGMSLGARLLQEQQFAAEQRLIEAERKSATYTHMLVKEIETKNEQHHEIGYHGKNSQFSISKVVADIDAKTQKQQKIAEDILKNVVTMKIQQMKQKK